MYHFGLFLLAYCVCACARAGVCVELVVRIQEITCTVKITFSSSEKRKTNTTKHRTVLSHCKTKICFGGYFTDRHSIGYKEPKRYRNI